MLVQKGALNFHLSHSANFFQALNNMQFEKKTNLKMKVFLTLLAIAASATAEPPSLGGYGVPVPSISSSSGSGGYQEASQQEGGQVRRYVSVHIAPEEGISEEKKIIRVPGGDKHVNIIFVKAPSGSSQQQTEVILPEQDEQKNIVYVLTKKPSAEDGIKIRRPSPVRQTKPEVFFIRYKDEQAQAQNSGQAAPSYGAPNAGSTGGSVGVRANTGSAYGAPF